MFTNMFLQYHVSTWLTEMCQKLTRPGHVTPGRADWWAQEDPMAFWPALSKPSPVLGHALETPSDLATKRSKEVFRTNLDFVNFRKNNLYKKPTGQGSRTSLSLAANGRQALLLEKH